MHSQMKDNAPVGGLDAEPLMQRLLVATRGAVCGEPAVTVHSLSPEEGFLAEKVAYSLRPARPPGAPAFQRASQVGDFQGKVPFLSGLHAGTTPHAYSCFGTVLIAGQVGTCPAPHFKSMHVIAGRGVVRKAKTRKISWRGCCAIAGRGAVCTGKKGNESKGQGICAPV